MTEGSFEGFGGIKIFTRAWRPAASAARRRGHLARIQLAQRSVRMGRRAAGRPGARGVCARSSRPRPVRTANASTSSSSTDYVDDVADVRRRGEDAGAGVPVFLLGHSAGGVVACVYALEHQAELTGLICESFALPGARAGLRAGRDEGPQPHRAARARAEAQERRLLARSAGRGGDERRPAHRQRSRSRRRRSRRWCARTSG